MLKTLTGVLFVATVPALVFFYPKAFSAIIGGVFYVVLGLFALIIVVVLGSLAWRRFFPDSFGKSGIHIVENQQSGYVGSPGIGSRLRIQETDEGIRVEWATFDYVFILLALGFFGPGMILLYVRAPQKFSHDLPLVAALAIALFVFFLCGIFVRTLAVYLWARPSLQIAGGRIEFLAGKKSVRTLGAGQIRSLFIRHYTYTDSHGHSGPNYILAAQADSGEELLCISDRRTQIEQLMKAIAVRIGVASSLERPADEPSSVVHSRGIKPAADGATPE